MAKDVIAHMRDRRAKCRLLAKAPTTDDRTAKVLMEMAQQIDDDIRRLEAQV